MSGGFGAGFLKGALVSLIAAAAVSLLVPLKTPDPSLRTQVDLSTPAGSGFNAERTDTQPQLPQTDQARNLPGDLQKPVVADPGGAAPSVDASPANQPEAAVNSQAGTMPAPAASAGEDRIATLQSPDDASPAAVKPALGMPTPVVESPIDRIPVNRLPTIQAPSGETEASPGIRAPSSDDAAPDHSPAAGLATGPGPEAAPDPQPSPIPSVVPPPPVRATERPADDQDPDASGDPATAADEGRAAEPASTLPPTATIIARATPPAASPAASPEETPKLGGLKQNRIPPAVFPDKPLMSVILVDVGKDGVPARDLLAFTIPLSIALDPARAASKGLSEAFASNGFEVLALTPEGEAGLQAAENATDMDTALAQIFAGVPRAVGLLDRPAAELQRDMALTDQVIDSLARSGYGLMTYDIGLNSADQKALRAGIPAATVFRVLDNNGESEITIKRFLDRAALEAGKVGHVVVLGHSRPETVKALLGWAVSAKSASVSLVPVSTVLLAR